MANTFDYGQFWVDLIEDLQDPEFLSEFVEVSLDLMGQFQEYKLEEIKRIEEELKTHDGWTDCTGRTYRVHKRTVDCDVNGCAIHNPSFHPLSDAKQLMRSDKFWLIERVCKHGVGHPDPDSASFIAKQQGDTGIWVHGCDGCCQPRCYCGCKKSQHMGKPQGCLDHGFHEYSVDKPSKSVLSGWGPHVHQLTWADDGIGHAGMACISDGCDYYELD